MKKIEKEEKKENKDTKTKIRQIIIETDGNDINIVKAEVVGVIEFTGILQKIINHINKPVEK